MEIVSLLLELSRSHRVVATTRATLGIVVIFVSFVYLDTAMRRSAVKTLVLALNRKPIKTPIPPPNPRRSSSSFDFPHTSRYLYSIWFSSRLEAVDQLALIYEVGIAFDFGVQRLNSTILSCGSFRKSISI